MRLSEENVVFVCDRRTWILFNSQSDVNQNTINYIKNNRNLHLIAGYVEVLFSFQKLMGTISFAFHLSHFTKFVTVVRIKYFTNNTEWPIHCLNNVTFYSFGSLMTPFRSLHSAHGWFALAITKLKKNGFYKDVNPVETVQDWNYLIFGIVFHPKAFCGLCTPRMIFYPSHIWIQQWITTCPVFSRNLIWCRGGSSLSSLVPPFTVQAGKKFIWTFVCRKRILLH